MRVLCVGLLFALAVRAGAETRYGPEREAAEEGARFDDLIRQKPPAMATTGEVNFFGIPIFSIIQCPAVSEALGRIQKAEPGPIQVTGFGANLRAPEHCDYHPDEKARAILFHEFLHVADIEAQSGHNESTDDRQFDRVYACANLATLPNWTWGPDLQLANNETMTRQACIFCVQPTDPESIPWCVKSFPKGPRYQPQQ